MFLLVKILRLDTLFRLRVAVSTYSFSDFFKGFENIEGFSRTVSLEEIKNNDYNLNVTLYVFPEEKDEKINIEKDFLEKLEVLGRIRNYLKTFQRN